MKKSGECLKTAPFLITLTFEIRNACRPTACQPPSTSVTQETAFIVINNWFHGKWFLCDKSDGSFTD